MAKSDEESTEDSETVQDIDIFNPKAHLGKLALVKTRRAPVDPIFSGLDVESQRLLEGPTSHVALMRRPELIVNYLEYDPLPTDGVEYAGVFRVDDSMNSIFAKAEPPAHESWNYQQLEEQNHRSYVRVALNRITQKTNEFIHPERPAPSGGEAHPLGAVARRLGNLIPAIQGIGAEVQVQKPGGRGSGRGRKLLPKARIRMTGEMELLEERAEPTAIIWFEVDPAEGTEGTKIRADVQVGILDGNLKEKTPPIGSKQPWVVGWRTPQSGVLHVGQDWTIIPAYSEEPWGVEVGLAGNASVVVNLIEDSGDLS
ncbi:hypothetical protein ACFL44_00730 [Gemmatimonadota bacterium]